MPLLLEHLLNLASAKLAIVFLVTCACLFTALLQTTQIPVTCMLESIYKQTSECDTWRSMEMRAMQ